MSKLYQPPLCEVLLLNPTKVVMASGDADIEKADPTIYDDDFWSNGA